MLHREDRGPVAIIRMSHGKVNALDAALCDALANELDSVRASDARAAVLVGTGTAFSAGVDLFQVVNGGAEYISRFLPSMDRLFRAALTFPKPLVAAVNGHAIAGGCILAAACDHRVMAEGKARIGIPELAVGVPFPTLALEIVAARVHPALMRGLVYSSRTMLAQEAVTTGLAEEHCEEAEVLVKAVGVAEQLATIPRAAFALTKEAFFTPILDRVRASASVDDRVSATWSDREILHAIQSYLDRTLGRK